jgi:hypothetical protein
VSICHETCSASWEEDRQVEHNDAMRGGSDAGEDTSVASQGWGRSTDLSVVPLRPCMLFISLAKNRLQ